MTQLIDHVDSGDAEDTYVAKGRDPKLDTFAGLKAKWRKALKSEGRYWQAADELQSGVEQRVKELRDEMSPYATSNLVITREDCSRLVRKLTAILGEPQP